MPKHNLHYSRDLWSALFSYQVCFIVLFLARRHGWNEKISEENVQFCQKAPHSSVPLLLYMNWCGVWLTPHNNCMNNFYLNAFVGLVLWHSGSESWKRVGTKCYVLPYQVLSELTLPDFFPHYFFQLKLKTQLDNNISPPTALSCKGFFPGSFFGNKSYGST